MAGAATAPSTETTSENLTRAEAQDRSAVLQTQAYLISLDLTGADPTGAALASPETTFGSTVTVGFRAGTAISTHLDLIGERVVSATLDGEPLDPDSFTGTRLPFSVDAGDHELTVASVMRFSRVGQGLHRFVDPADGLVYTYTQFEVSDARRVFGCFEQPDLKGAMTVSVRAPKDWTVISNAPAATPTADGDDHARWDFDATAPISTYLVGVVAGHYAQVRRQARSAAGELPMSLLVRRSLADSLDADRIFDATLHGFEVLERAFDFPYPYGSYDQAFVPEYNMGAMENVGCVTLRDEYVFRSRTTEAAYRNRDNTIWHELAHMWFGDLVTMVWWDDLWLKESFAEWSGSYTMSRALTDPDDAWAMFCNGRKNSAYRADQLPSTHPIAADMVDLEAVETNFDGITYAKGGSVLRQLVAYVGEDDFLAGVQQYFRDHQYGNTRLDDLLTALTAASGRDLSQWSGQWLETSGVNTLRPVIEEDESGSVTAFAVQQTADPAYPTLRDHRVAVGLYTLVDQRLVRTGSVETDVRGPLTEVPELVGTARPDLVLVNDSDLTYAKVRFDPRSLATLLAAFPTVTSALTRAVCWAALWSMVRDAELPAGDYVDVALRAVGVETDPACVQATVNQLIMVAETYGPVSERPELLRRLESGLLELVTSAEAGSDHQLTFVRGYAAAVGSPEGAQRLLAWLSGSDVPAGLAVDTDLRWLLLRHAARLGAADETMITAEEERDPTIAGRQAAAAARAARPTAEAKAAAWQRVTAEPEIANETQLAICRSFWQRGQEAALDGYAERYFELVTAIAERSGQWATMGVFLRTAALRNLFPPVDLVPDVVERVDAWLAGRPAGPALGGTVGRIVAECRDEAARALRCQRAG